MTSQVLQWARPLSGLIWLLGREKVKKNARSQVTNSKASATLALTSSPGSSWLSIWRWLGRRFWHTADHVTKICNEGGDLFKVFRYSFFGTIAHFLNRLLDSLHLVGSTWNLQYLLASDWTLAWFTFCENRYFHDNDKQKSSKSSKIEILRDPDFILKSKYQDLKLWCMANMISKNKRILYVCFEVNRKNIFNLSFCVVIVNAPKNDQCFNKMVENTVKMCLLLIILRLESFFETGVRDFENELFF